MQTENSLLKDSVDRYWKAYRSDLESAETRKAGWSDEALSAGIVSAAVRSLAAILSPDGAQTIQVVELEKGAWCTSTFTHGRARVSIFGLDVRDECIASWVYNEIHDRARESLCLCIVSKSSVPVWEPSGRLGVLGAAGVLALYPDDVDALANGSWTVAELVEYKLYRRLILEKPDPETQYDPRLLEEIRKTKAQTSGPLFREFKEVLAEVRDDFRKWVGHPLLERASKALKAGRNCLLTGPSSSGKSVLSFQVGRQLMLSGEKVVYLNLGTMATLPGDALKRLLLAADELLPDVIILDDLQSSPAGARYLLALANMIRRASTEEPPSILAITWPDFAREAVAWVEDCLPLAVRPHHVQQGIVHTYGAGLGAEDCEALVNRFADDLLLLRVALEMGSSKGSRPSLREMAENIWKIRTDHFSGDTETPKRVALVAGSLGRYDMSTPRLFLQEESLTDGVSIELLERSGLLRKIGDYLTIGHRSLCALLVDWLTEQGGWQSLSANRGPMNKTSVVLDYLRSMGSSLAVDTLRALRARAGFKEASNLNRRAAALVEIWKAFDTLVERIEHQQAADFTWGNTPSSAMFAIQALAQLGKATVATPSMEFVRRHWRIEDGELEIEVEGISTVEDFIQIGRRMADDDDLNKRSGITETRTAANEIDLERFHKTWMAGVVLCAEGAFNDSPEQLNTLARAVERMQLENGAFHPDRVPWATARVLLGLSACGRTIDTSAVVSRAAEWLLRDTTDGGACSSGLWQSGTGTWNSTTETTGLVLAALAASGVDCNDERLSSARNYLLSQRGQWTALGGTLDGALSIQAYLDTGGSWEEVAREAQQLSQWALGEAFWRTATTSAEESLQQSCRVAQIASYLVNIGWSAIRSDLPAFLDALATPASYAIEPTPTEPQHRAATPVELRPDVVISSGKGASSVHLDAVECLRDFSSISLRRATVVKNYRRHDERIRNRMQDWAERITNPLKSPSQMHENYLVWAAPGSGKSFFVQEIARDLGTAIEYCELNLAQQSRDEFRQSLSKLLTMREPVLCLLDEIDARADETWPYEDAFSFLDLNTSNDHCCVFVLIGSSPTGLQGLIRSMNARSKGEDLISRIPSNNRFEIPPMTLEDRVVIIASKVMEAMSGRNISLCEIEKLALYYILVSEELKSPRQLTDLAMAAVQRMPIQEHRLRYEDLFARGDRRSQDFWVGHQGAAAVLSDLYVRVAL